MDDSTLPRRHDKVWGVSNPPRPSPPVRRRPTVRDVAVAAGVSPSTVSNVLNNHPHIRPEKRARVNEAIAQVGYRPSFAGRQLRNGKSNLLALAIPDIRSPYFANLAHTVMLEAQERGFSLFIDETGGALEQERDIARGYPSRGIDGIIFCPVVISLDELEELKSDIPTVLIGEYLTGGSFDHIAIDSRDSARGSAEYLIQSGRRHFAFIGARLDASSGPSRFRLDGLRDALVANGLSLDDRLVLAVSDHTREEGRRATEALMNQGLPVDAIICAADLLAVGALSALRSQNLAVPHDVAVMGWDDSPEAHYTAPPLTSIAHDMGELARQALQSIERRQLDPSGPPLDIVVPHRLVARESTSF